MFDHLQELSYRDRSNNWSNIGFCEEIAHIKESIVFFYALYLELWKWALYQCFLREKHLDIGNKISRVKPNIGENQ